MHSEFQYFAGIDWGSEKHRVCLMDGDGSTIIEHALLLLPRLRLLHRQRTDLARRIAAILEELATPADGQAKEHRDAAILLSLPRLGRKVAATMLSELSQAVAGSPSPDSRTWESTNLMVRKRHMPGRPVLAEDYSPLAHTDR